MVIQKLVPVSVHNTVHFDLQAHYRTDDKVGPNYM